LLIDAFSLLAFPSSETSPRKFGSNSFLSTGAYFAAVKAAAHTWPIVVQIFATQCK